MKAFLSGIILLLVTVNSSVAQAPQVYAELGGPSVAGINFDTRFSKKENGLGGRIGVGGFTVNRTGFLFLPVGINHLIGKPESKNFLELGLNITYVSALDNGQEADPNNNLADTWGSLTFGYRYQPPGQAVTFRASVNPIFAFQNGVFWPFYGAVSIGYKFK